MDSGLQSTHQQMGGPSAPPSSRTPSEHPQYQHQHHHQHVQQQDPYASAYTPTYALSGHGPSSSNPTPSPPAPKIRRRNRLITSCLECRRRKLKCDKSHPCSNCTKFVRDCVFLAPALDPIAAQKLAEIKEKMGSLERTLEDDVARRGREAGRGSGGGGEEGMGEEESGEEEGVAEDERDLEPTPLALQDAAYYDDADDDIVDLGVQIGKMRINERVGGMVRPKFNAEITHVMNKFPGFVSMGPASSNTSPPARSPGSPPGPGAEYIAPSSSFFFAPQPRRVSIMEFLPARDIADRLMAQYWSVVHLIARILHRPSFERQYVAFWEKVEAGVEPPASLQALVLAAMFAAVVSMSEESVTMGYGVSRGELLENFRQGAETALYKANFLRTTKLQTLQAFVLYLIPLCRREVSRAHSVLTGTAIRLAECMGLHRDGTHYGLSAVEVHVRRMVWYQLCYLDIRTCEATGPRPQIHKEDFDTRFPLNVDDTALELPSPPTEDAPHWTDMTLSRIRFECNEMHRFVWNERARLEKKKTALTVILGRVQEFVTESEKRFLPMMDMERPIHYMGFLVFRILSLRLHVMVLHRYATNHNRKMPERLRKILLTSGVTQVEAAITIETAPVLRQWAWYCGAIHQYHTTLLLLTELYATDIRYHEDRIWKCLDYVFELPPHLSRKEKGHLVLQEIITKTETFHSLRRVRAPKSIEETMGGPPQYTNPTPAPEPEPAAPPTHDPMDFGHPDVVTSSAIGAGVTAAVSMPGIGPIPTQMEYKAIDPSVADQVFYAPPHAGVVPIGVAREVRQAAAAGGGQGRGARGASVGSCASAGEQMLDIDWNEWDKLFPPDVSLGNMHLPDYQFSNHFPPHTTV
ncbi:hypothetical protein EJ06DRAFT_557004 [Trichodelitschia bisporula]|uniref:Zn(2)-C6 fungal-type domain-containing protein n=1 Tax=Trichodelitschia bisporula TaxID=703511 RepID=A0A6G1HVG9_9PEZI|nr:hypothetical protein EJ06DRAFT_557004 [Trichodelitschia bisporula]